MSSLFKFDGIIVFFLILVCTATYAKGIIPSLFIKDSPSFYKATLWKLSRIGERLSPWVSIALLVVGVRHIMNFGEK